MLNSHVITMDMVFAMGISQLPSRRKTAQKANGTL
jgi:hypothetical protein